LAQGFFGLNPEYKESLLEQFFLLQYHLGMSYSDVRNLPVPYRKWYLDRLVREFEKKSTQANKNRQQSGSRIVEAPMGKIGPRSFK
jgi:hypothetical protein